MPVWPTVLFVMMTHLLACISPGPDFAVVVRNAICYQRALAVMTTFGVALGVMMHATYCALGLALLLIKFPDLFMLIRYLGALYLIYLGVKALCSRNGMLPAVTQSKPQGITLRQAFLQGFFVNALNPKAVFFIFSLFIMVAKLKSVVWNLFFIVEMAIVTWAWFAFLVYCVTHPKVKAYLTKIQKPLGKILGIFLVFFGVRLLFEG